jgi:hypothetical protein
VSTFSTHAGTAGNRLLGSYVLHQLLTGDVYHDFLRNVLPEILQDVDLQIRIHIRFMHDGAPQRFLLAVWEFLNNVFPEQWLGWDGTTAWSVRSPDLYRIFVYGGICSLLFMPPKLVTSRTCNNEYRMDLRWFVRHLEFCRDSGGQCSDVQSSALKLMVDILSIFFNLQEAVTRKPCFRRPMFV